MKKQLQKGCSLYSGQGCSLWTGEGCSLYSGKGVQFTPEKGVHFVRFFHLCEKQPYISKKL